MLISCRWCCCEIRRSCLKDALYCVVLGRINETRCIMLGACLLWKWPSIFFQKGTCAAGGIIIYMVTQYITSLINRYERSTQPSPDEKSYLLHSIDLTFMTYFRNAVPGQFSPCNNSGVTGLCINVAAFCFCWTV